MQILKLYSSVYSINLERVNQFMVTSMVRHFQGSSVRQRGQRGKQPTRLQRICLLNRSLYIHRNTEMGPQPIFYRGSRKVDLWQRYLDKKKKMEEWRTFSRQSELQDNPVDDVYLVNLYKPKPVSLKESLIRLKENTLLDLTDQSSNVMFRVGLQEMTRGKGKRKKPVTFFKTTTLPHPQREHNKVCVFSDDEALVESALNIGACAAGSTDLSTKILSNTLACDAYFTTPEYYKAVLATHSDLKVKLAKFFPSKHFGLVDHVDEIIPFVKETIYHNFEDPLKCKINVGKISYSAEALEENVMHILDCLLDVGDDNNYVTFASLSCYTEPISLDLKEILDYDDV